MKYITSKDTAEILGINISTLKRWTDNGTIECTRTAGGHRKFTIQHVRDYYKDNEKAYIISPQGLKQGDVIESGKGIEIKVGNSLELRDIPPGTTIHNVELIPGNGAKLARSAGSSVTLSGYDGEYAILKLSSGETRKVSCSCIATIGTVSNPDQKNIKIGKAGRNRWRGKRPQTRGVAMNPVDHPHGGGEGKTSGGRSPVSPWGQSAKGLKTRRPKRSDKLIITRRKKRK